MRYSIWRLCSFVSTAQFAMSRQHGYYSDAAMRTTIRAISAIHVIHPTKQQLLCWVQGTGRSRCLWRALTGRTSSTQTTAGDTTPSSSSRTNQEYTCSASSLRRNIWQVSQFVCVRCRPTYRPSYRQNSKLIIYLFAQFYSLRLIK